MSWLQLAHLPDEDDNAGAPQAEPGGEHRAERIALRWQGDTIELDLGDAVAAFVSRYTYSEAVPTRVQLSKTWALRERPRSWLQKLIGARAKGRVTLVWAKITQHGRADESALLFAQVPPLTADGLPEMTLPESAIEVDAPSMQRLLELLFSRVRAFMPRLSMLGDGDEGLETSDTESITAQLERFRARTLQGPGSSTSDTIELNARLTLSWNPGQIAMAGTPDNTFDPFVRFLFQEGDEARIELRLWCSGFDDEIDVLSARIRTNDQELRVCTGLPSGVAHLQGVRRGDFRGFALGLEPFLSLVSNAVALGARKGWYEPASLGSSPS